MIRFGFGVQEEPVTKRTKIEKRTERAKVTVKVDLGREMLAALRSVRGYEIRTRADAERALAHVLLDALEDLVAQHRKQSTSVDQLNLSERAMRALRRAGVSGVNELEEFSVSELRRLADSSAGVAREIAKELERIGISIRVAPRTGRQPWQR